MQDFWMANGFVSTPEAVKDGRQDYFNPTTPRTTHVHPQPFHTPSPYSLRTQRSSSSLSWTTVRSDTNSLCDFSDEASISTFSTSVSPNSLLSGRTGSSRKAPARMPSLSIDPRLFAPQTKHDQDDEEMLETARPKNPKKEDKVVGSPKRGGKEDSKKKASHARKQTADHIPRPRNAFILFRKHVVDSKLIPASVEVRHQNVSIITAKMWSEADPQTKAHFNELARIEKEEHMKKYPGYRYQPVYRRTNVIRRRVRKDEAEEEKCKSVAELLMKGKSGQALEAEIKDKITEEPKAKYHRKSSGACELSKGALRALRAQARQRQQSSDWSDISRATSVDLDGKSAAASRLGGVTSSPEPAGFAFPHLSNGIAYPDIHCGLSMTDDGQTFVYPTHSQDVFHPSMGQASTSESLPSQQLLYPQPRSQFELSLPDQASSDFYSHHAIPFPLSDGPFVFPAQDGVSNDRFFYDPSADHPPMSARWDKGHLLPPSSEVPLEGLPFDDGFTIGEFDAALAHADDMIAGVW
nr:hypothetical protein L204_04678 [Cryptococcus depauperatus CBS 7855]